ncbi:zinc-finger of the MIZ type in Nse subunit-domain-containing protein [Fusarium solani]|uniref:Zinc-finger of the MIZ type in Nse subunit-domain-containing protein n=1 Tax=Fusarium solani TaxID=169388 RepID=A0A9P9R9E6_FUSSL|nr:zinc-finger of the MIZ type in Nse subunit-domain-containing protein [Fusarium solani]KAH7271236.1 zinc-finger of the MIZ type in Nse subunit-domain-containing protein [Fusarium solani]
MSRRLLNRSGVSSSSTATTTTALPEYQPPSCPLSDAARRDLNDLSHARTTVVYQQQLGDSVGLLSSSIGDLHEQLREQRDRLESLRAKRQEKGNEKTPDEERLETHVADLEARVNALTDSFEEAIRVVIDYKAELEDEGLIITDLYNAAAADVAQSQRRPRRGDDAESAEEADDDVDSKDLAARSILERFKDMRAKKKTDYTAMDMHQRYALNNDYAGFKKLWHDAMAGEDGPPLPDASRWFRPDGRPVMRATTPGAADDDDDDDIAVAREVLSINCPLTLQPMKQPYSNRKCKHTFEKAALLDYLPLRGDAQCPQTGCSERFSRSRFDHDFYLDQAMVRRIKRARQAQEQHDMDEDDDEGEEDEDVVVRGHQPVPGRVPKKERV